MTDQHRPILPLPLGRPANYLPLPLPRGHGNEKKPTKKRLVKRLGPKFKELERVLDARRAELADHASGVSPEQILVFETTRAGITPFIQALQSTSLAWLADHEREGVAPDSDYFNSDDPERLLTTRLFMVMANVKALEQLLSLWHKWSRNRRGALGKHVDWAKAFAHLRDVRYWGPQDRVTETGLLEEWHERVKSPFTEIVPIEIELWFRNADTRAAAEARIRMAVAAARGRVLDVCVVEEISYHAVLAEMPIRAIHSLLADHDTIALARSHDVYLFHPMPQQPPSIGTDDDPNDSAGANQPPQGSLGTPTVALFDGLPLQRHVLLDERLVVHDPDDWEADYPSSTRRHGTAMASLILHGDLGAANEPAPRRLFVRPILRPVEHGRRLEEAPTGRLWIDVIHRAVLELVGTENTPAAVPEVRVVNLSIGDRYRPFLRELSPVARLLDWLACKYGILFVVSAGNHQSIMVEQGDDLLEDRVLQAMQATHRSRRLLSPAESINALTVGALPLDDASDWSARNPEELELIKNTALPSAISALGRGFRGAIKPEILAPGGRVVYVRSIDNSREFTCTHDRARIGPGQRVAAPGRAGDLSACEYSIGTSNAAALVSRAAMQIMDVVRELGHTNISIATIPVALVTKALLVHTSTWDARAYETLRRALQTEQNRSTFRDYATAFLGYGCLQAERALGCEVHRATLIGGGELELERAAEHRIPLPANLNAYTGVRRIIVTLAWFSPVRPSHRAYRVAALEAVVSEVDGDLGVGSQDAHANATKRGTIQHRVYEGQRTAVRAGPDGTILVTVSARPDAPGDEETRVPYALAVTLEVDANTLIAVYDEIATRIRPRVRADARG